MVQKAPEKVLGPLKTFLGGGGDLEGMAFFRKIYV